MWGKRWGLSTILWIHILKRCPVPVDHKYFQNNISLWRFHCFWTIFHIYKSTHLLLKTCLVLVSCVLDTAVSCKPSSTLGSEVSSTFVSTMELCHPSVRLAVRRVCMTQMLLPGLLCWASVTWPINGKMFTLCHFSWSCRWAMSQKQIKRQINWCSM